MISVASINKDNYFVLSRFFRLMVWGLGEADFKKSKIGMKIESAEAIITQIQKGKLTLETKCT
jgi:hypothetical protein